MLIISNECSTLYIKHKELWLKYMNNSPFISCFFIEYHPEKNNIIENNTFYLKGTESYHPGCRDKTIDCFEYFLNSDTKYDYIIRTNLSSLWNFKSLLIYLKCLPKENLYSGVIGTHDGFNFASGSGFIMTPDVVKKIVENRYLCDEYNLIDDVDIAYLLKKIGILAII